MLRLLHLAGSAVSPFLADLSRLYAADCLEATADPARYAFHVAWVTPDGCWRFPADLSDGAIAAAAPLSLPDALARIVALDVDVVVPQMFCLPGMTAYRGLFDLLGVPYVGNIPAVMALGADKAKAKAVVAAAGVAVPAGQLLRPGDPVWPVTPAVVKPVDSDNSVGVTLVRDPAAYDAALATAFAHSSQVLVERYMRSGAASSSGTGSSSACRWRSTRSTASRSPSGRTTTRSARTRTACTSWPRTASARGSSTRPIR